MNPDPDQLPITADIACQCCGHPLLLPAPRPYQDDNGEWSTRMVGYCLTSQTQQWAAE